MANVVITGSTRGIGRGLAVEFLKRGHNVVVSSRKQVDVGKAVSEPPPSASLILAARSSRREWR